MIEINIPGINSLQIEHLVCDVNGTLALDGQLLEGVADHISLLKQNMNIHLITADTHGKQTIMDQQLGLTAVRLIPGNESLQKAQFVQNLGAEKVIAIGQGANDAEMLEAAALGICILSREGCAKETLLNADLVLPDILSALELISHPLRMVATLRR